MKSNNNNNNDDDDDNNNNTAMGSVHARGDTFLTFGLKALTETNTSRLTTVCQPTNKYRWYQEILFSDARTYNITQYGPHKIHWQIACGTQAIG
jgi:hypothetical protein